MPHKIVVTICSKKKNYTPGLVPAIERYLGEHIQFAANAARPENIPFFILSGKFGLVAERQVIPNYDYRLYQLDSSWTAELIGLVARDLSRMRVREIELYIEPGKDSWALYIAVIEQAAQRVGARLTMHDIVYPNA